MRTSPASRRGYRIAARGEILRRRHSESSLEHGGECTRAVVADIEGYAGDTVPNSQTGQSLHKSDVLAPGGKSHACFTLEVPGKCPSAHGCRAGQCIQRIAARRIRQNRSASPFQVRMARHRHMKRNGRRVRDLVHDQVHDAPIPSILVVFDRHDRRLYDQFAHQRGNFDYAAIGRQVRKCRGIDVQGSDGYMPPAMHLVKDCRGNPQGPLRRNNERSGVRNDTHDSCRCVQQLGACVTVAGVDMVGRVLIRERGDRTRHVLVVDSPRAPLLFGHLAGCPRLRGRNCPLVSSLAKNRSVHLRIPSS